MSKARTLNQSKKTKNDEFYTLYRDIADELPLYRGQMKGMRIICPCDWDGDPAVALTCGDAGLRPLDDLSGRGALAKCNFVKFLVSHTDEYGIRAVSASGYDPSSMEGIKFQDVDYGKYDLAITNPPFSLFREFIQTMFDNRLKFLVVGPANAMTYKDVFSRMMNNEMWLGHHHHLTGFALPDGTILPKNDALVRYCCWYTNLDVPCRHDRMVLTEKYDPQANPAYCNYDGIDVGRTAKIPCDYSGNMGVPITFMQKYNPDQFEIVGSSQALATEVPSGLRDKIAGGRFYIQRQDGGYRRLFDRIVIRNRMA